MHCLSPANGLAGMEMPDREANPGKTIQTIERLRAYLAANDAAARRRPGAAHFAADCGLPASFAAGVLNELTAAYSDRPAALGFLSAVIALGLAEHAGPAVLVTARRALAELGALYGHGLAQLGLQVERLILIETATDRDALWALEETLRSGARPAVVAGALEAGLDLTSSRRLNLAAAPQRTPLFLLTGPKVRSGRAGTSAAATRWRIAAAPAARDRYGALAGPRWHVALERSRMGSQTGHPRDGAWLIEWSHDHGQNSHPDGRQSSHQTTHRFRVVERLADCPADADAERAASLLPAPLRRTG